MATVSGHCDLIRVHHTGDAPHLGVLLAGSLVMRCALGRSGIRTAKREGDGASPKGIFPVRKLYFRPDRVPRPHSSLEMEPISADLGWCDDPGSMRYNTAVRLPFAASHERMWRDDHLYDLVIVIGFNDDPAPLRPFGSAIFLHLARPGFAPTEGCVALRRQDFLHLLPRIGPQTEIAIG